jgi:hypothetical protein
VLAPRKVRKRLKLHDEREKLITRDLYRFKLKSAADCGQLCIEKNSSDSS